MGAAGLEYVFDYLAVRLNGPAAEGRSLVVNLRITDTGEEAVVRVENCVLHGLIGRQDAEAAVTLSLERSVLNALAVGGADLGEQIESRRVSVDGEAEEAVALFGMLDVFDRWFAVVTP